MVPVSDLSVPRRPTRRLAPGCRPPAARPLTSPSPAHPVALVSPSFPYVLSPRVDCRSRFCIVGADMVIVDSVDGGQLKLRHRIPSMVTVFQFILPAALLCLALAPDHRDTKYATRSPSFSPGSRLRTCNQRGGGAATERWVPASTPSGLRDQLPTSCPTAWSSRWPATHQPLSEGVT